MIKRLIVLVFVLACISGGTWYFFSKDPSKSVEGLREKIDKLLQSNKSEDWYAVTSPEEQKEDIKDPKVRISIARKVSDLILQIHPKSEYDLEVRVSIEELDGKLEKALFWCDKISTLKNPPASIELRRAKILRKLGKLQKAKGSAAAVLDVYPFAANYELGQLHRDTFAPFKAYLAFQKAKEHATSDDELFSVYEGLSSSLDLLISSVRNQWTIAKRMNASEQQIYLLTNAIESLRLERNKTIDQALSVIEKAKPQSRSQYVNIYIRMFDLINKKQESDGLDKARKILQKAVAEDKDVRYFPLYLALGSLEIQLAYSPKYIDQKEVLIKKSIDSFSKAFSFDFEGKSVAVSDLEEWDFPETISKDQFEARLLLRICLSLLGYPEYWRVLAEKDQEGNKDVLDIHARLDRANALKDEPDIIRDIGIIQAVASLKDDDIPSYEKKIKTFLSASTSDDRSVFVLKLADGIASFAPHKSRILLELIDKYTLPHLRSAPDIHQGDTLVQARSIMKVLHQARNTFLEQIARETSKEDREKKIQEVHAFTEKIKSCISVIAGKVTTPEDVLMVSKLTSTLVGLLDAEEILLEGYKKFPDDLSLQHGLAQFYLDKEKMKLSKEPWDDYHQALDYLFKIYVKRPYDTEILDQILKVVAQIHRSFPDRSLELARIIKVNFPKASSSELKSVSEVLNYFLQRDFKNAISHSPPSNEAINIRPFLNLITGICYLETGNYILQKQLADSPVISGGITKRNVAQEILNAYRQAKKEFEAGLRFDSNYIPFHLELMKMELNTIKPGESVPDTLMQKIRGYASKNPDISQSHYLLSLALKKTRNNLIQEKSERSKILKVLAEERGILRRTIRSNSSFVHAYIALAESYVISWRMKKGPLKSHEDTFNKLGTPEFNVAISILKSAPSRPQTVHLIAQYYDADGKLDKALAYYKQLAQIEPVESNVAKVVQAYIKKGDPQGAKEWVSSLDGSRVFVKNFSVMQDTLIAYVIATESASPLISENKKAELEEQQVKKYYAIIEESKKLGEDPPLLVVNNLAYILANREQGEDALQLIEPTIMKLRGENNRVLQGPLSNIEDTYAWSLYKSGKVQPAITIYQELCSSENAQVDIRFNYARILYGMQQYEEAIQQIDLALKSGGEAKRRIEQELRTMRKAINDKLSQ